MEQKTGMVATTVFMAVLLNKWTVFDIEAFVIEVAILVLFLRHVWDVVFGKPRRPNSGVIGEEGFSCPLSSKKCIFSSIDLLEIT
jgi:hypothetical protein